MIEPSSAIGPAIGSLEFGSYIPPTALVTIAAPTVNPSPNSIEAVPNPPFMALSTLVSFPTVPPVPAPTVPCKAGELEAFSHAIYPFSADGRTF